MPIIDRVRKAWNAFNHIESQASGGTDYGSGMPTYSSASPSRVRPRSTNERSIISSIHTRISVDVAGAEIRHVQLDDRGRYQGDVDSRLNECLTLEPNMDQGPRQWRQDVVMTLIDKGCVAIVPVDTTLNPLTNDVVDIYTMRVGEITAWYPKQVRVSVWNEEKGVRQEILLPKRFVAIVENPLYNVMNEPNSTYQRLVHKLNLLDSVDEATSSGKLDLIVQLPYAIKTDARRQQAEIRRADIEFQLKGSKYGIAYLDGTEKITQLNRPVENNLLKQIEFLTELLYNHLGLTKEIMDGTASEEAMLNYLDRTVEPILDAIVQAMQRSFLGLSGTKKGQRISYFRNVFKLVPISQLAEIADKFTRNEIASSNEFRGFIGLPPSDDPKADELRNSNMPMPDSPAPPGPGIDEVMGEMDKVMNEVFDEMGSQIEELTKQLTNE